MPTIEYQYDFHPVGQGLFASGRLQMEGTPKVFTWVFDCGTVSGNGLVYSAITDLKADYFRAGPKKPRLDLVVLSHFDQDHISGVVRLLKEFSVDILLLPYMPLWQRLLIAFDEGVDTQQELMLFFLNPAAYLRDQGGQIERIVFVPPSSPDELPEGAGPSDLTPDNFSLEGEVRLQVSNTIDEPALFGNRAADSDERGPALELRAGAKIPVGNVWEFVPYNDSSLAGLVNPAFQATVSHLASDLTQAKNDSDRKAALKKIRDAYDKQFGKSSKRRNLISLFVYSGPCVSASRWLRVRTTRKQLPARLWIWEVMRRYGDSAGVSCLYTGDGYLNTPKRFGDLQKWFGPSRTDRVGLLQVMHHGASANWYPGFAGEFPGAISIFSSDPSNKRLGHPHADVLRDFWPYFPVQVDKNVGFQFEGELG